MPDSYNNRVDHYNRLRYPMCKGYFNAGVLLVDVDFWRRNNVLGASAEFAGSHADVLLCHDQDVLNCLFQDNKVILPLRYNMLNEYWFSTRCSVVSWQFDGQIADGQRHPVIVHFTGLPKPWFSNCRHPMKRAFEHYRALSPWCVCRERMWLKPSYVLANVLLRLLVCAGWRAADSIEAKRYVNNVYHEL